MNNLFKTLDEEYLQKQRHAKDWIEIVLSEPPLLDDLSVVLKDGRVLCKVIMVLEPGIIDRYNDRENIHKHMMVENINLFLRSCRWLGLPQECLFEAIDLFEARNMRSVIDCLLALEDISNKRSNHFQGPSDDFLGTPIKSSMNNIPPNKNATPNFQTPTIARSGRFFYKPPHNTTLSRTKVSDVVFSIIELTLKPLVIGVTIGFSIKCGIYFNRSLENFLLSLPFKFLNRKP